MTHKTKRSKTHSKLPVLTKDENFKLCTPHSMPKWCKHCHANASVPMQNLNFSMSEHENLKCSCMQRRKVLALQSNSSGQCSKHNASAFECIAISPFKRQKIHAKKNVCVTNGPGLFKFVCSKSGPNANALDQKLMQNVQCKHKSYFGSSGMGIVHFNLCLFCFIPAKCWSKLFQIILETSTFGTSHDGIHKT